MNGRSNNNRDNRWRDAARRFFPALVLLAFVALFVVSLVCSSGRDKGATNESKSGAPNLDSVRAENGGDSSVDASPGAGERKAFLVAADDYGVKASALPGAKRDVEALRARLLKIGFEERNVVTLQTARTDDGEIDFDLLPQKAKIEERFKAFVDDLQPGDFAFVFLSGHGLEAPRTNEAFFVPIDFDPDKPLATSVSVDAMMAALAKSAAKFRWFAVDACRSRPSAPSRTLFASKSTDASPLSEIANVPASVVLLQSCRSGQSSYEGGFGKAKDISNGFFALSLLEALDPKESKADENKDGAASFLEICRYATTRTNALAQTYYKRKQEPTLSGADITDFPFLTGLLVDGLPYDEWKRANDAFEAAKASRLKGEYEAALDKLALALQIAPENEACRAEETELRQLVAATKPSDGETSPTLTPEQAKARYLEGRRMAWGLDGTNVYGLRAFEALKEAAENGCAEAAGELARFYVWGGEGTDVDYERAKSWAEKGAESGDPTAQFILAWIYYLGRGVEPDDEKAEAFGRAAFEGFRRLAESGDVVATYWLGKCCYMGIGVEKNDADAARYYREASEANLPAATRAWGEHRLYGIGVEKDEADGANLLCAAADRGDASAMCALGMCYRLGVGVDKDDEEAYERYRQAAERSEPTGTMMLGQYYLTGSGGVEKDETRAFEWFRKAADVGGLFTPTYVGWAYRGGVGVERDKAKELAWYRKAAELGNSYAALVLANYYEAGVTDVGVKADKDEALKWRRKAFDWALRAAKMGDAWAIGLAGHCFENGYGVEKNRGEALRLYRKGAELGNAQAIYCLARFYYEGGVEIHRDEEKAFELYRRAAELGVESAIFETAYCYFYGEGVEEDKKEALNWYRRSAALLNKDAMLQLARYYQGRGDEGDDKQAFEWYRQAAELGDAEAMWELGRCYERALGVERDDEKAVEWYCKATKLGNEIATSILAEYLFNKGDNADSPPQWMLQAVETGDPKAALMLARFYKGMSSAKNLSDWRKVDEANPGTSFMMREKENKYDIEAAKWSRKAAAKGADDKEVMIEVSRYYSYQERNAEAEFKCRLKAAELGDVASMRFVEDAYEDGDGITSDSAQAFEWNRKRAELGDVSAIAKLARRYETGDGVEASATKAAEWWRKAAELGNLKAMVILGKRYETGDGVATNAAKAVEWYRRAAELDEPEAMSALGECYENSVGVEKDDAQALEWRRKAFESAWRLADDYYYLNSVSADATIAPLIRYYQKGFDVQKEATTIFKKTFERAVAVVMEKDRQVAKTLDRVAYYYEIGFGVEPDPAQAFAWRREAATKYEAARAIEELARYYEEGIGVPQDAEKAKELRRRLDEAMKAAGGEASKVKIDLDDDFKNDGVPVKID